MGGMNLDKLAIIMKEGFDDLRGEMVDGFDSVDERFDEMRVYVDHRFDTVDMEIRQMRRDFGEELSQLRTDIENIKGFAKEIDTLISRVTVLENKFSKLKTANA